MNRRLIALCVATLGAALIVPSAEAQRGFGGAPIGRTGTGYSRGGSGYAHVGGGGRFLARSSFAPFFFYPDYDTESEAIEEPPPQVIILQAPQPATPIRTSPGAMVIELQGDHWVRVTNSGQSQTDGQSSEPGPAQASHARSASPPVARAADLPAAVLVFRDGHTEEIGKYLIVGSAIYASADYWTSGSWTRRVQIAQLDVPATLKLNRERGANFSLPSGPGEVMVRP